MEKKPTKRRKRINTVLLTNYWIQQIQQRKSWVIGRNEKREEKSKNTRKSW